MSQTEDSHPLTNGGFSDSRPMPTVNHLSGKPSAHGVPWKSLVDGHLRTTENEGIEAKSTQPHLRDFCDGPTPIAVVGMSCRFPGESSNPEKLWDMLANGRHGWSKIPPDRFPQDSFQHPDSDVGGTFNSSGGHFLSEDLSRFDAPFFNISPLEAKAIDPQMRILLETAYEALENGGTTLDCIAGTKTAVYCGVFSDDYGNMMLSDPESLPSHHVTGTGKAIFANRISYYFDLKGPSLALDTGCSASLVALHEACKSIRSGESEQAIVGGTNLILSPKIMISLSKLGFLSNEGRCYSFDSRGDGYGRGEGVTSIFIKPLEDALAAGLPIRAVIRNMVVNQDGKTPGITMPSGEAQVSLMRAAYAGAGLDPVSTGYVESHGTGTKVGDPIEVSAIAETLAQSRSTSNPLIIGSVKANIGHLESASGLAGIIKAVLCVEKGMIPPSINFVKENEALRLKDRHMRIAQELQPWPLEGVRRASVNSFGYGGTNAHVILDAYDRSQPTFDSVPSGFDSAVKVKGSLAKSTAPVPNGEIGKIHNQRIFVLSHRTKAGVLRVAEDLKNYVSDKIQTDSPYLLDDLAHTLNSHRTAFNCRIAVIAASLGELLENLSEQTLEPLKAIPNPKIGLVFTGQGAQWFGMGRELIDAYDNFKTTMVTVDGYLHELGASWSILEELMRPGENSRINSASISQPLCTAIQIALVHLLESWNIRPVSVTGHSSGEIAAAYTSGAITLEAALQIAYHRGRVASATLERSTKLRGAMIAVGLSELDAEAFIAQIPEGRGKAVVACVNSPGSVTVSGDRKAVLSMQSMLEARQIFVRRLAISTAYHSHHMESVANTYLAALQDLPRPKANNQITFYSSVTGHPIDQDQLDGAYWVKNMISQVRFSQSLQALCKSDKSETTGTKSWDRPAVDLLIEVGPHSGLAGFVKQNLAALGETKARYMTCLVRAKDAVHTMLSLASEAFVSGFPASLNAANFPDDKYQPQVLIDLPPYPWDHSVVHWHESRLSRNYRKRSAPRHPLLGAPSPDFNHLEPSWRNIVRVSEIPWIRGHVVQSKIIYPAAGYICMAIEAALQRSRMSDQTGEISRYRLKDIAIGKPLLIPDTTEGIETMLSLRSFNQSAQKSSEIWDEFRVFSYAKDEGWNEHCRGLITLEHWKEFPEVEGDRESQLKRAKHQKKIEEARLQCQGVVDPWQLYEKLASIGLQFKDAFQSIQDIASGPNQSLGTICIPNTASAMQSGVEHPHILHPATLDACMQMTSPSLIDAGALQAPMVPTFIKEIFIDSDVPRKPGEKLTVHTSTRLAGKRSSRSSLSALNTMIKPLPLPSIEIYGLICTAIPGSSNPGLLAERREICHRFRWEDWIDDRGDGSHPTQNGMVSTPQEDCTAPDHPRVTLVEPTTPSLTSQPILSALSRALGDRIVSASSSFEDMTNAKHYSGVCLVLSDIEGSILHKCNESHWLALQQMLCSASNVLWITHGAAMDTTSSESGLIVGLARSSRSENDALRFVTLDLDPKNGIPEMTARAIIDVMDRSFGSGMGNTAKDFEFVERAGRILVPRLVEDAALQRYLTDSTTVPEPDTQRFFQSDRPFRLAVGTPGLLDSLHFIEDETAFLPLAADELRMEPRAYGVNFRDIMISLGQLEDSSLMSSEHSGLVTEVGRSLKDQYTVGDRICAWGGSAYASSIKVNGLATSHIPDDMSFETAASIPIVYATVYYGLVILARLKKGETVLIHSAAGGVGQAAVMLAQYLEATVIVTVGSSQKKRLIMENYNIPEEHIFSSRHTTFVQGIERLTDGKGVDVVLNSIAGEAFHETCNCKCIARLGRFIEIGKRDILSNARMEMEMFNRNVTFASVDLSVVLECKPGLVASMLSKVFRLLRSGAISPVKPLSVFPLTEIQKAFRLIQAGKHIGKVILQANPETTVRVIPRAIAPATFAEDGSYLIVGGTGGLGRAMCRWMGSLSCKNIILISRSGLEAPNAPSLVHDLKKLSVKLVIYACDISNAEHFQQTLKKCAQEMPPIRGVIQSAMVVRDAMMNNMTIDNYRAAIRPKMQGTINLHRFLPGNQLAFFIILSSCAGILGNDGQANYASGCTFQDAFARYRTNLGMPTRSLDLGMIEGAGYVSENLESLRFLTAQGFKPVRLNELLALLNYAISQPVRDIEDSQLVVGLTGLDKPNLPSAFLDAKFSHVVANRRKGVTETAAPKTLEASLRAATSLASARSLITSAMVEQVSKVLVVPLEDINPSRSISAYGGDSLAAVELRNWFAASLNASVGVMEILSSKSIEALAAETVGKSGFVDSSNHKSAKSVD